jgi:uncharacterized protein
MIPGTILLAGIVGSTAYGLAHDGSDTDRLGLFAAPTVAFHGLHQPAESHVATHPDATYHEAAKWCRLALGGNPTVTELTWLPDDLYETRTPLGNELIAIRASFFSAKRVRDAYLGYATQQFRKLEARGDGSFSSDTRKRTAKHARHLWRLIAQGTDLNATGKLSVRLSETEARMCLEFGERVAAGDLEHARDLIASAERHFDEYGEGRSALPASPDESAAEAWLRKVRREMYQEAP